MTEYCTQHCQIWLVYVQDTLLKVHQLKFFELQLITGYSWKFLQISKFGAKHQILIFGRTTNLATLTVRTYRCINYNELSQKYVAKNRQEQKHDGINCAFLYAYFS